MPTHPLPPLSSVLRPLPNFFRRTVIFHLDIIDDLKNATGQEPAKAYLTRVTTVESLSQSIAIANPRFREPFLPFLSTAKDHKALNIDSAKSTLAQQFPAMVNRELGHNHDADILSADASFI